MNKTLKWILGIVIGLVVIAILAGVAFMVFEHWGGGFRMVETSRVQPWGYERQMPNRALPDGKTPNGEMPYRGMPMHPYEGFPMARYRPLGGLGVIIGSLLCLGVFALIVLGIIALVRAITRRPHSAEIAPPAAPVTAPVSISPDTTPTHPCPNCDRPVQDDWTHCPYCGTAQAG
jgi:zinc-ribbon domain